MILNFIPQISKEIYEDHKKLNSLFSIALAAFNSHVKENKAQNIIEIMAHIDNIRRAIIADELKLAAIASINTQNN